MNADNYYFKTYPKSKIYQELTTGQDSKNKQQKGSGYAESKAVRFKNSGYIRR